LFKEPVGAFAIAIREGDGVVAYGIVTAVEIRGHRLRRPENLYAVSYFPVFAAVTGIQKEVRGVADNILHLMPPQDIRQEIIIFIEAQRHIAEIQFYHYLTPHGKKMVRPSAVTRGS
jgi:hypothetical protein